MTPSIPPLESRQRALFLDFDGTLVEIAARPEEIVVGDGLRALLDRLATRLGGALAIVSGRPLDEIDGRIGEPLPGAGLHGLEVRAAPGAAIDRAAPPAAIAESRRRLAPLVASAGGLLLEDKGATFAVHYRARPDLEADVRRAVREAIGDMEGVHAIEGKMVVEVKPSGHDKGHAVRRLMAHAPFAGRVPVFVGDDVTDEDGFAAVAALGGYGVKVGEGDSAAAHRIADVGAVHRWLGALADDAAPAGAA